MYSICISLSFNTYTLTVAIAIFVGSDNETLQVRTQTVRRSAYRTGENRQFSGDIFIRRPQRFTHIPPHDPHTRYARSKAIMNQITYLAHLYLANDFSDLAVGSMAGQPSFYSSLSLAQVPQVIGIDLRYADYATMKSPCQTYRFGPDQMPKPFSRYH